MCSRQGWGGWAVFPQLIPVLGRGSCRGGPEGPVGFHPQGFGACRRWDQIPALPELREGTTGWGWQGEFRR